MFTVTKILENYPFSSSAHEFCKGLWPNVICKKNNLKVILHKKWDQDTFDQRR